MQLPSTCHFPFSQLGLASHATSAPTQPWDLAQHSQGPMLGLCLAIDVPALPARSDGVTLLKLLAAPYVAGSDWAVARRQDAELLPSRCPMDAMEVQSVALEGMTPPTADSPGSFAASSSLMKRVAPVSWTALVKMVVPSPQAFAAAVESSMMRAEPVNSSALAKMPRKYAPSFRFRDSDAGQRCALHFSMGWWRAPLGIHLITCPWLGHRRGVVMVADPPLLTIGLWETPNAGSSSSHWTAPTTNAERLTQVAKPRHWVGISCFQHHLSLPQNRDSTPRGVAPAAGADPMSPASDC